LFRALRDEDGMGQIVDGSAFGSGGDFLEVLGLGKSASVAEVFC